MKIFTEIQIILVNYLPTALHQAAKSRNCMRMSTGIYSALVFGSTNTVCKITLPVAVMRPTGPLKFSIRPGKGSGQLEVTA